MGDKIRICEEGEEDEIKIFSNSYFDGLMYNLSNNLNYINYINDDQVIIERKDKKLKKQFQINNNKYMETNSRYLIRITKPISLPN